MLAEEPEARALIDDEVLSVIVPPPFAAVATWKKLLNELTVLPVPPFEIVEVNV